MTLTYLDSGVLITLFRASDNLAFKAQEIIDDSTRQFASSYFVKLETRSKAIFHKQIDEVNFYNTFFDICNVWANDLNIIIKLTENLASQYGLNALDALQIASAISVNADEFITTEKPTKPLHRVTEIKVTSLMNI